jgi:hypothetical protein
MGMSFRWSFSELGSVNVPALRGASDHGESIKRKSKHRSQHRCFEFIPRGRWQWADMGQEDLALPFLKVLSGNDPILDDADSGARKGDIFNTVTGEIYKGGDGINVIPCAYQRRFICWAPRGEGSGAPQAIYEPGQEMPKTERSPDDNKDYVVGGEGEYIEETHQHFVVVINEDGSAETALIAMKSTQLKKSRKWNSMMQSVQMMGANGPFNPPRYSHIYQLKTVKEENSKGSWHGWEMSRVGPITDKG